MTGLRKRCGFFYQVLGSSGSCGCPKLYPCPGDPVKSRFGGAEWERFPVASHWSETSLKAVSHKYPVLLRQGRLLGTLFRRSAKRKWASRPQGQLRSRTAVPLRRNSRSQTTVLAPRIVMTKPIQKPEPERPQ